MSCSNINNAYEVAIMKDTKACNKYLEIMIWSWIFCAVTYVVYMMSTHGWPSDYPAHIRSALEDQGYSLLTVILRVLYLLSGNAILLSCFIGAVVACTGTAIKYLIMTMLDDEYGNFEGGRSIYVIIFSYAVLFVGSIKIPRFYPYFYIKDYFHGAFLTQPWQNSTYVVMRLFAVLSFAMFLKCLRSAKEGVKARELFSLFIVLALANAFKPNFIIAFAPSAFILCLINVIKEKERVIIVEYVKIAVVFILSLLPLIFQYMVLFGDDPENGWGFTIIKMLEFLKGGFPIYVMVSNFIFPVLVLFLVGKMRWQDQALVLAWIHEILTFFEAMFLTETGSRAGAGNFGWNMMNATLILFVVSFAAILKLPKEKKNSPILYASVGFLLLNIFNGLMYFGNIFQGQSFYC